MNPKHSVSFDDTEVAFAHRSDNELKKIYNIFALMHYPFWVKLGIKASNLGFKLRLPIKGLMKKTVFGHFCGGENIGECKSTIEGLANFGIGTILDYSVEGKKEEENFEKNKSEILKTIAAAASSEKLPFTVFKISGLGDVDILVKVQAGEDLTEQEKKSFENTGKRVDLLCNAAYEAGVKILIDGEESWFQEVVDKLVYTAMEKYNKKTAIVFNTFQMYRQDMMRKLKDAHHDAVAKGYYLGAKLVRGAYLEKERARAEAMGYPSPIHVDKESSDKDFDTALQFCINNKQRVYLVSGTHNELSNIVLTELVDLHGMKRDDERVYFAQLYGMSDHISYNLAKAGFNVAKYVPYGPIDEVLPYLSRRVEENSGIAGQSSREFELIKKEIARRKASGRKFQ